VRQAWQCRGCKGPPLPEKWEGCCPNCHRPYRPVPIRVAENEVDGAEIEPMQDGRPISPAAAAVHAKQSGAMSKTATGLAGFDWILGGGIMRAKAISLCGPEGCGKTSLLARLALACERSRIRMLLLSSEQTPEDLVVQFERYGKLPQKYVSLVHQKDHEKIKRLLEDERPDIFALDSIHDVEGVTDEDGFSMASGGQRAVHTVAKDIRDLSRDLGTFSILVCHMNSDGTIKGGTSLRHEVDGTLMLDRPPEKKNRRRVLRFNKYRFAPPNRRALFLMLDDDFKDCGPLPDDEEPREPPPAKPGLRLVDDDFNKGA
jgi:DNA repair protein RadA/Sms